MTTERDDALVHAKRRVSELSNHADCPPDWKDDPCRFRQDFQIAVALIDTSAKLELARKAIEDADHEEYCASMGYHGGEDNQEFTLYESVLEDRCNCFKARALADIGPSPMSEASTCGHCGVGTTVSIMCDTCGEWRLREVAMLLAQQWRGDNERRNDGRRNNCGLGAMFAWLRLHPQTSLPGVTEASGGR